MLWVWQSCHKSMGLVSFQVSNQPPNGSRLGPEFIELYAGYTKFFIINTSSHRTAKYFLFKTLQAKYNKSHFDFEMSFGLYFYSSHVQGLLQHTRGQIHSSQSSSVQQRISGGAIVSLWLDPILCINVYRQGREGKMMLFSLDQWITEQGNHGFLINWSYPHFSIFFCHIAEVKLVLTGTINAQRGLVFNTYTNVDVNTVHRLGNVCYKEF